MAVFTVKEFKRLLHLHYIINIILAISYVLSRTTYPVCALMYPAMGCELDFRETEILTFLAIVIVFRSRKQGLTSMIPYVSSVCMYSKIANILLFFYADPRLGVVYLVLSLLHLLLLPEPSYEGPDNVIYFRGSNFKEELERDKRITWLVAFYATWSPACVNFAPVFAELSTKYSLDNLCFGKVDITRYPEVAEKCYISTSTFSKQLPTVILYQNNREVNRRPTSDNSGKLIKFFFSEENVLAAFDLNNLYQSCKSNQLKKGKKKEEAGVEEDHEKLD